MLFCNEHHNLKSRKIASFKVVILLSLFVVMNNWSFLNNIFNIFNGGTPNFLSIEKFVSDILHISRVVSVNSILSIGIGAILVKLVFTIIATIVVSLFFKGVLRKSKSENNTKCYAGITIVEFATSDIYLKNDKLIC